MSLAALGVLDASGKGVLADITLKVEALSEKDLCRLAARFEEQSKLQSLHIDQVEDYTSSATCRRQRLLDYFGDEQAAVIAPCDGCDVCGQGPRRGRGRGPGRGRDKSRQQSPERSHEPFSWGTSLIKRWLDKLLGPNNGASS